MPHGATPHPTARHRPVRRARPRWTTVAAAVVAMVVLGGTIAWATGRDHGPTVVDTSATDDRAAEPSPPPSSSTTSTTAAPPTSTIPRPTPPTTGATGLVTARPLTPDGPDAYAVTRDGGRVDVGAPPSNRGGNLRVAIPADGEPSPDHEVCATWDGPVDRAAQPGLALRVRDGLDGAAQSITITNNVYGHTRWVWNVHLWLHPHMWRLASVELPGALHSGDEIAPLPWRLCARVVGSEVSFVVWTGEGPAPRWDDPDHSGRATLPDGWTYPGQPGVYVGHLAPGAATAFEEVVARSLTRPVDRAAVAPATG